jgi:hypothetical protein
LDKKAFRTKVEWDIVVAVKQPADLKGIQPGKLPESLLRPAVGGGRLHWLTAAAWAAMVAAAKADGIELKPVSAADTYRTYESQLAAFKQRYTTEPNGNATRTFEGKKWYKKDPKLASLAAPGTSQHNIGLAVDVHTAGEPKRLKWLIANVRKFGFSWEVVPEEPWHLRYTEGDNPPPAVVEFMAESNIQRPEGAATPAAKNAVSGAPTAKDDGGDLDPGDSGPRVVKLQEELAQRGFYDCSFDGQFGPKTEQAVVAYKKAKGYGDGSKAGKRVLEDLGIGL